MDVDMDVDVDVDMDINVDMGMDMDVDMDMDMDIIYHHLPIVSCDMSVDADAAIPTAARPHGRGASGAALIWI